MGMPWRTMLDPATPLSGLWRRGLLRWGGRGGNWKWPRGLQGLEEEVKTRKRGSPTFRFMHALENEPWPLDEWHLQAGTPCATLGAIGEIDWIWAGGRQWQ